MGARQHKREAVAKQPKLIPLNDREFRGCQLMKKQKLNQKTYSQGDRVDSRKDRWERAVGGVASRIRRLLPPRGPLVRDPDCCEEEMNERSQ